MACQIFVTQKRIILRKFGDNWKNGVFAAGFGRREVVEYLLEIGGDVSASDEGGLIPLHNACSFGHAEVVRLLIEAGSGVNNHDRWGYTPLHEAAIKGKG